MPTLVAALLFFFAVALGLSQVSMMTVFMGGQSQDASGLLDLLNLLILPMLLICTFGIYVFRDQFKAQWLHQLWQRTPGWLVFAFLSLNFLVFTGFWAFLIVTERGVEEVVWRDLLPLITTIISSLGFVIFYAYSRQKPIASYAERNAARAGKPPEWEETWKN